MAKQCAICGKKTRIGRQVSHAHNVSARPFKPNLNPFRAKIGGTVRRILVCTRCVRSGRVTKAPARRWQQPDAT